MDSIEDMFENRLPELVDLLHDFFLQVERKDGRPYLGETLITLLHAIGRIIRARLEGRSIEINEKVEEFYILNDPQFKKCCLACFIAVRRSIQTGIGRKRKATALLMYEMGQQLLASLSLDRTNRRRCLLHVAYYAIHNFCVRGQKELYSLSDVDFTIAMMLLMANMCDLMKERVKTTKWI